jgi:hypothetical protein
MNKFVVQTTVTSSVAAPAAMSVSVPPLLHTQKNKQINKLYPVSAQYSNIGKQ